MSSRTEEMEKERYDELRAILEEWRAEITIKVKDKIRTVRSETTQIGTSRLADATETSEAEIQDDIEFALIQMKTETLTKITATLNRLEEGSYGYCYECGEEIAKQRLRVLPFAARCRICEEVRESEVNRERVLESRSQAVSLSGVPSN